MFTFSSSTSSSSLVVSRVLSALVVVVFSHTFLLHTWSSRRVCDIHTEYIYIKTISSFSLICVVPFSTYIVAGTHITRRARVSSVCQSSSRNKTTHFPSFISSLSAAALPDFFFLFEWNHTQQPLHELPTSESVHWESCHHRRNIIILRCFLINRRTVLINRKNQNASLESLSAIVRSSTWHFRVFISTLLIRSLSQFTWVMGSFTRILTLDSFSWSIGRNESFWVCNFEPLQLCMTVRVSHSITVET